MRSISQRWTGFGHGGSVPHALWVSHPYSRTVELLRVPSVGLRDGRMHLIPRHSRPGCKPRCTLMPAVSAAATESVSEEGRSPACTSATEKRWLTPAPAASCRTRAGRFVPAGGLRRLRPAVLQGRSPEPRPLPGVWLWAGGLGRFEGGTVARRRLGQLQKWRPRWHLATHKLFDECHAARRLRCFLSDDVDIRRWRPVCHRSCQLSLALP